MALAQRLWAELHQSGQVLFFDDMVVQLGQELGVEEHMVAHVLTQLDSRGQLWHKEHGFFDGLPLACWYGETYAREEWRTDNEIRQRLLKAGIPGYEAGARWDSMRFTGERLEPELGVTFEQAAVAATVLELLGLVSVTRANGKSLWVVLTAAGYDLVRDEQTLIRTFPRTRSEDEERHADVVPDVLSELITTCEQLLRDRGWTNALEELGRGDARHGERNWKDAVSEYYAAVESGLLYRINEVSENVSETKALKGLASRARELGLIPATYQALFGFLDSVRSPRKHGQGPRPETVEIGPAESLLMGNHARALLVYLAQRPRT